MDGEKTVAASSRLAGESSRISTVADECHVRFGQYISHLKAANIKLATQLKTRFETWDTYSGARAQPGFQLDDRLEELQQVKDAFIALLETIGHNLSEGNSAV